MLRVKARKEPLITKEDTRMSNIFDQMEADFEDKLASSVEKLDQSDLTTVAGLAKAIRDQEEAIAELEANLKQAKKSLMKMTDEDLPTMLAEIGLSSMTLDDGSEVSVKQTYGASILVDNRPKAYQWLRDNGFGDIVKNTVSCSFGMGEDEKAEQFREIAEERGYLAEQDTSVHSSTLRAWVKERVENGDDFPMELFGAYVGQRAIIRRKK
jgi:small-conductance mechanosensitive channel